MKERVFTDAERETVERLLARVLDEMSDSYTLSNMFAPYAEIVEKLLTDERIDRSF